MVRTKTHYVCSKCGETSIRWLGRCPGCGEWNTLVEEAASTGLPAEHKNAPLPITEVSGDGQRRFSSGQGELDRVLGGGIMPGSLVLLGGDPGIGKSTLLLQVAGQVAQQEGTVLYVSGEESALQIQMRARRLEVMHQNLLVFAHSNVEELPEQVRLLRPSLLVVDSIQTMYRPGLDSAPGSVGQVRESAALLLKLAKEQNVPVVLVGHVTKEGALAGPRVLEHMVDTVLYFEGDHYQSYRLLRAVKNRFGSTNEIGVFEMTEKGLQEVANPSAFFLAHRPQGAAGSAVVPGIEGSRAVLLEIQALVAGNSYNPRRLATGLDIKRTLLMIAVLDKRVGLKLADQDIYVNVAGGVRIEDPSADLALCLALASSWRNQPVEPCTVVMGEVGLTGEIRPVGQMAKRLTEAAKMGFTRAVVPQGEKEAFPHGGPVEIIGVRGLAEALDEALEG